MKIKEMNELEFPEFSSPAVSDGLDKTVEQQLIRQIHAAMEETARTTLKNYGIELAEIAVQTDTSEEGGIYITRITLYLDKQNISKATAAKQVMEQRLGTEVFVEEWDG